MVSYDEILSRMENAYKEKTDVIPDENSDTGIKLRVLAGEIFNMGTELEWFKRQMFPSPTDAPAAERIKPILPERSLFCARFDS